MQVTKHTAFDEPDSGEELLFGGHVIGIYHASFTESERSGPVVYVCDDFSVYFHVDSKEQAIEVCREFDRHESRVAEIFGSKRTLIVK